jgi:hypothetical protein
MCRNIKPLYNFDPPVTADDVHASALQYVRKVSGYTRPSKANEAAFREAVERIAQATEELLAGLVTDAAPRSRAAELERAREKAARRYGAPRDA